MLIKPLQQDLLDLEHTHTRGIVAFNTANKAEIPDKMKRLTVLNHVFFYFWPHALQYPSSDVKRCLRVWQIMTIKHAAAKQGSVPVDLHPLLTEFMTIKYRGFHRCLRPCLIHKNPNYNTKWCIQSGNNLRHKWLVETLITPRAKQNIWPFDKKWEPPYHSYLRRRDHNSHAVCWVEEDDRSSKAWRHFD